MKVKKEKKRERGFVVGRKMKHENNRKEEKEKERFRS